MMLSVVTNAITNIPKDCARVKFGLYASTVHNGECKTARSWVHDVDN